jgi:uncharacterized cupredoxin-like copper-binding protein
MKTKKFSTFCAAIAISGIVGTVPVWAGGTHGGSKAPVFLFGSPGNTHEVTRTVEVKAGDMEFHVEGLDIKEGETIRFVVKNVDEIDHDFTIGPPALQAEHREEMMRMMETGDGMAKMHNDPNAVYLKPGETKELVWKFENVVELEYACNVPGHYESGMMGRFQAAS